MTYKAVSRIKVGTLKTEGGEEYYERGDVVDEGDFDEQEWDELVAAEAVMEEDQFNATFPETKQGENQAYGTPSNLEQVEGTNLQMNPPEEQEEDKTPPANPADPPVVPGASEVDGSHSGSDSEDDEDNEE